MFSPEFLNAFLAAAFGAVVSVVFCGAVLPGTHGCDTRWRILFTIAYAIVAGYFAVAVVGVSNSYQAFLIGIGLDSLLQQLRERTRERQFVNTSSGAGRGGDE